jgi:hypothetical protein
MCKKMNLWNNDFQTISIIELWDGKFVMVYKYLQVLYVPYACILACWYYISNWYAYCSSWLVFDCKLVGFLFQIDMHLASWLISCFCVQTNVGMQGKF